MSYYRPSVKIAGFFLLKNRSHGNIGVFYRMYCPDNHNRDFLRSILFHCYSF